MANKQKKDKAKILLFEDIYSPERVEWAVKRQFNFLRALFSKLTNCDWVSDQKELTNSPHDVYLQMAKDGTQNFINELEYLINQDPSIRRRFDLTMAIDQLVICSVYAGKYFEPTDLVFDEIVNKINKKKNNDLYNARNDKNANRENILKEAIISVSGPEVPAKITSRQRNAIRKRVLKQLGTQDIVDENGKLRQAWPSRNVVSHRVLKIHLGGTITARFDD